MRIVRTPSWSRNLFSGGELAGMAFGYGPSFWIGTYDPVTKSSIKFNDSGIRIRRKRRKLRQRRLVDRNPVAVPILSPF